MADACFSPASLGLLAAIGTVLQAVIVSLFYLGIRAKDDSIKDARDMRDRALDLNDRALTTGERQTEITQRALPQRGRRS